MADRERSMHLVYIKKHLFSSTVNVKKHLFSGLMSCLLRLSLLLLLSLMSQYESGVVSLDSMYPGFHSSSVNQMDPLVRQVDVAVLFR